MAVDYRQYEFQVYGQLVQLQQAVKETFGPKAGPWLAQIAKVQEQMKDRRFCVAVVGEFKRGKSSFINALLGQEVLPVNASPATATVNRVTYGAVPRAYLCYKDGSRKDVELGELAGYVTKLTEESVGYAASIREAVVEYPSMFCQNYVDLLDTPGMNDDEGMSGKTIDSLGDVDLAILTVSASYPFSETECMFMVQLLEHPAISQIVVAVTYIDRIREQERERLLIYIRDRIKEDVLGRLRKFYPEGDGIFQKYERIFHSLSVFGVSSLDALEARRTGDLSLLVQSGFSALNERLPALILSSQNSSALQRAMEAVGRIGRECRESYPRAVSGLREDVGRMEVLKHRFAREGYGQAALAADGARVRLFGCLNQFQELTRQELEHGFTACFSQNSREGGVSCGQVKQQWEKAYHKAAENIRLHLDPKLQSIFRDAVEESFGQFCARMRGMLQEFQGYFSRQEQELTELFYDSAWLGLGESQVVFGWTAMPLPDSAGLPEAGNRGRDQQGKAVPSGPWGDAGALLDEIRKAIAGSLDYYCIARKKEVSAICEKASQEAEKRFEQIAAGLFVRIQQYGAFLKDMEDRLKSGHWEARLGKIEQENERLKKEFLEELQQET